VRELTTILGVVAILVLESKEIALLYCRMIEECPPSI